MDDSCTFNIYLIIVNRKKSYKRMIKGNMNLMCSK